MVSFGKKRFKYLFAAKALKIDLYVYFSPKWLDIENTLMKLNIYLFNKRQWIIRKMQWNFGKKLKIVLGKNLIVKQYAMENI